MSRRGRWIAIGVIGVAGVVIFNSVRAWRERQKYEWVKPRRGDIKEAVYGLGKVKTNQRFEVKLGVISTVKRVFVSEGDQVSPGDKLIEFDSNALFRAPFSGTVTLVSARDGETVLPNVTELRLENLHDRFIEISLEQEGALRIRRGQEAKVSFESLRGQILTGKVVALFPKDDEFLAHVRVEGLDEGVLPGMTADVSIEIGKITDALLVPLKTVSSGSVVVRRDGRREKVKVEVGHVDGLSAEIKGDALRADDELLMVKTEK